jgi:hypothetical protein
MPSGPPAERELSLLIMRVTKVGEKEMFEMPGLEVWDTMLGS